MNKIVKLSFVFISLILLVSCVPQRKFAELESKYNTLKTDKQACDSISSLYEINLKSLRKDLDLAKEDFTKLNINYIEMEAMYEKIKKSYNELTLTYEKRLESESLTKD